MSAASRLATLFQRGDARAQDRVHTPRTAEDQRQVRVIGARFSARSGDRRAVQRAPR